MGRPAIRCLRVWPSRQLHGDEGPAVFFADVVDGADVGMVEGGGGFGFAAKAAERLGIFGQIVGKKFQSDEAVESGVLSFVDDPMPPPPSISITR